jgi:hypothetical protein
MVQVPMRTLSVPDLSAAFGADGEISLAAACDLAEVQGTEANAWTVTGM